MYASLDLTTKARKGPEPNVAVLLPKESDPADWPESLQALDAELDGRLAALNDRAELKAGDKSITLYPHRDGAGVDRVLVARVAQPSVAGAGDGAGDANDDGAAAADGSRTLQAVRQASAELLRAADAAALKQLRIVAVGLINGEAGLSADAVGRAVGDGISSANFRFDTYAGAATAEPSKKPKATRLKLSIDPEARAGFARALTLGESASIARSLAATPPNVANPKYLVDYCRKMASKVGLTCKVIDAKKAEQLGMGGLIAVGKAGSTPPALICLEWAGKPAAIKSKGKSKTSKPAKLRDPLMLVGKAITFDTGGYSLKPPKGMVGMKYDKCGGMAVIGAMHAIASLKLKAQVVGVIAAAENMVDSGAYRPNDIITHVNGVTTEITNTDAEGRLVLADALAWGSKTYKPRGVVDLATLTGGVVVALGSISAGMFCNDRALRERMFDAAASSGERLWHLPLWDEHRDLMRGNHSDLCNSSIKVERECHPIQGAAYLSFFATKDGDPNRTNELPWAHLDIAGTATTSKPSAMFETGPTGFGVRLLADLVEQSV